MKVTDDVTDHDLYDWKDFYKVKIVSFIIFEWWRIYQLLS